MNAFISLEINPTFSLVPYSLLGFFSPSPSKTKRCIYTQSLLIDFTYCISPKPWNIIRTLISETRKLFNLSY